LRVWQTEGDGASAAQQLGFKSMSYLVIARKWRPQTFADIAGQEHITRTLQNAIRAGRIAHAFLFTGVRGVGKTTAARILAKALNCEAGPTATPCDRCAHCQEIAQGNSIDVLEIDGASNRGIDEIRQIIENVRYQPAKCRFKIYIIDEVHQVTKDAFNALLKTLEEPPPSVKFILATTEPHRLPQTILSRCQRYDFRRISLREIVDRLRLIAKSEGIEITDGALILLAREADGSMRDAQSLLEQVLAFAESSEGGSERRRVDEASLQEILGLAERRVLYEISAAVLQGDPRACVELVAQAVNLGCDIGRLARDLVEHFRNLLVARLLDASRTNAPAAAKSKIAQGETLLDLPDQEISDLTEQGRALPVDALLDYFDFIAAGEEELARSATPRFALESVLIRMAGLPKTLPVTEWVERLERLEARFSTGTRPESTALRKEMEIPAAKSPGAQVRMDEADFGGAANWRGFIAFVGKEKKFLASHLDASSVLESAPGLMKIGVSERHHLAFLLDPDNFTTLKDLASKYFQQDMALQIVNLPTEGAANSTDSGFAVSENLGDERSPMVKEALRIFGGSVRNVRGENG
jgi:DNA polymerase-3 subunit gamma/tau